MKYNLTLIMAVGATLIPAAAQSQAELENRLREAERASNMVAARTQIGTVFQVLNGTAGAYFVTGGSPSIKNHPFSATEENRSTQTLADGTRIESKQTSKQYRDADGRTRTDSAEGTITIVDPVAGFRATLNPKTKTATKAITPPPPTPIGDVQPVGVGRSARSGGPVTVSVNHAVPGNSTERVEDLGTQVVNGVRAHGERVTVTIPKGQIGNDRDLKVVTERWTSDDLQMLVKSTNTDPRFGETNYELTGISLASPSPSTFQIPPDYSVTEARGAGRGKAKQ